MTTHLVIADYQTLNRLLARCLDRLKVVQDPSVPLGGKLPWEHVETGDRWLFRTPEDVTGDDLKADFRYWIFGMPTRVMAYHDYPLIAACDLLGVDEL